MSPGNREPTPRLLPSGWWDVIPENIRVFFDRKILRRGYYLHLDGKATVTGFFRNAFQVEIEDDGRPLVHYTREDESTSRTLRSRIACSCGMGPAIDSCPHIPAALFQALSVKGYESSPWSLLAVGLCRSHAAAGLKPAVLAPSAALIIFNIES